MSTTASVKRSNLDRKDNNSSYNERLAALPPGTEDRSPFSPLDLPSRTIIGRFSLSLNTFATPHHQSLR